MAYIIKWLDNTGKNGHSEPPIDNKVAAQRLVDYCNERFPEVEHRLEEVRPAVKREMPYVCTF